MCDFELLQSPLKTEDIEWRVGATSKKKPYVNLLGYKNARVDMQRLDEACGVAGWQNEYKRDSKGVLQCGIGIANGYQWIWKWSNGVESNTEKAKGEYSDAFKRAGFMWGIGRELYNLPAIWISLSDDEFYWYDNNGRQQLRTTFDFKPNEWDWHIDWEKMQFGARDSNGKARVKIGFNK